jgi:YD repeat-containing protein
MLTNEGPKVIEFNNRFGDPEAQSVLPRLKTDLYEIMVAATNDRLSETTIDWDMDMKTVTVVMAAGGYPGPYRKGDVIRGLDSLPEGVEVFHAGTGKNEKGEVWKFERDTKGNIEKETSFDKTVRAYERDQSGLVTKVIRPGGRFTEYQYDKAGNVARADYSDGTWEKFSYNKNGELLEASNGHSTVKFERNAAGHVTKEWQDGLWVASTYDGLGRRTQVTSSLGANILTARDEMGRATHMAASQSGQPAWAARFGFNGLGQEIERLLPGGVASAWQYDAMGRPAGHRVTQGTGGIGSARRETYRRAYEWDASHRLKSMTNELTHGETVYGYDEFSSLVQSGFQKNRVSSTDVLHRGTDDVGNLYESQDRSDRIYGAGSRLERSGVDTKELRNVFQGGQGKLATKGTEYAYDAEGNLIRKEEPDGSVWRYEYYGNGMLSKVIRPDGMAFTYKYDPLGRRIEKTSAEGAKRFLWDGDRPQHEWDAAVAGAGRPWRWTA